MAADPTPIRNELMNIDHFTIAMMIIGGLVSLPFFWHVGRAVVHYIGAMFFEQYITINGKTFALSDTDALVDALNANEELDELSVDPKDD